MRAISRGRSSPSAIASCSEIRRRGVARRRRSRDSTSIVKMQTAIDAVASLNLREVDDSIFGVDDGSERPAHYDRMGKLYDIVCGTAAYNRAVWGTTPDRSRAFATRIFES